MQETSCPSCGQQRTTGEQRQLLTINHVADWLSVSVSTLYHHDPGEGPERLKVGKLIRYRRCCVDSWITQQVVKSA